METSSDLKILSYPQYGKSDPRFYPSSKKKPGSPLIFFVHFYGGHQKVLKRHINLVNDLGYDAFCFNMPNFKQLEISPFSFLKKKSSSPLFVNGNFGMKHLYADMIRFYLKQIPGPKIVFSFSNPSASVLEVLAEDCEAFEVKGLICDSGPSLAFLRSAWNLAIAQEHQPWLFTLFSGSWSWKFHLDLPGQVARLPKNFPVLSIRGGKDSVIPAWHIEKAFKSVTQLNLDIALLPEAGHLDGLKRFPGIYLEKLQPWLLKVEKN